MKLDNIIVSLDSLNSGDPNDIIQSNISVINLLKEEGAEESDMCDEALASYYVDYYLAQYNNGDFSQFVYNTGWDKELNDIVAKALKYIGAPKHLALFESLCARVETLNEDDLNAFLESDYFGDNPIRDTLNDASFYDLDEDIAALNSAWLRNHPKLLPLSIDDMYSRLEAFLGRPLDP